jgi:6-pyruvoyltetrahydropterin/6-carboxytetrahydropterin synthase
MIVTKKFSFSAAHHLPNYKGNCANVHGHNYQLEVRVKGEVNTKTGMVIDFRNLSSIVDEAVISRLDHSDLNETIPNPTAENIAVWVYESLKPELKGLYEVQLWESEKSSVIYSP